MSMGFKYQVLQCRRACDLLAITMNHIDTISQMFPNAAGASNASMLLDRIRQLTLKLYSSLTHAHFASLRNTLCRFFIDRRIKVSIFLQVQCHAGGDG